jgi:mono/diheme cytochrome c family protein
MVRSQRQWSLLAWSAILLCVTEFAFAEQSAAERRGLIFVREYCSQCHAVGKVGGSPVANAAPFRVLRLRYPVADLQRPLLEGIQPAMPRFRLTPSQVMDVMVYLKTLEH